MIANAVQTSAPFGLDRVDQKLLPLDEQFNDAGILGSDALIYLLDTGIRTTHVEFQENRVKHG